MLLGLVGNLSAFISSSTFSTDRLFLRAAPSDGRDAVQLAARLDA